MRRTDCLPVVFFTFLCLSAGPGPPASLISLSPALHVSPFYFVQFDLSETRGKGEDVDVRGNKLLFRSNVGCFIAGDRAESDFIIENPLKHFVDEISAL